MHSRVTMLEIDTLRIDVDDAAALFDRDVLPTLREEKDYAGAIVLATPEGKGMILTLWDSETAAADQSGFATGELERFAALFRSPPGREYYRVVSFDLSHAVV